MESRIAANNFLFFEFEWEVNWDDFFSLLFSFRLEDSEEKTSKSELPLTRRS